MDTNDRDKMDELLELTRENNKILRSIHRKAVWSQLFSFIYWIFILGIAGWSYYFIQPYLSKYLTMYDTILSTVGSDSTKSNLNIGELQGLLEKVGGTRQ